MKRKNVSTEKLENKQRILSVYFVCLLLIFLNRVVGLNNRMSLIN